MPGEKGKELTPAQKGAVTRAANKAAGIREMMVEAVMEGCERSFLLAGEEGIVLPELSGIPERLESIEKSLDELKNRAIGAQQQNGAVSGAEGDEMSKDENIVEVIDTQAADSWLPAPMAQPKRTAVTVVVGIVVGVVGTISFGWLFSGKKSSSSEDVADIGGGDVELRIMEGGGL